MANKSTAQQGNRRNGWGYCLACGTTVDGCRIYCDPEPGQAKSACQEACQVLQRLQTLMDKIKEAGKRFCPSEAGDWHPHHVLANQLRDYSEQHRIPAGQPGAGQYSKPRNGHRAPVTANLLGASRALEEVEAGVQGGC